MQAEFRNVTKLPFLLLLLLSSSLALVEYGLAGVALACAKPRPGNAAYLPSPEKDEPQPADELEEPDFAFVASGAYTQPKASYQLIVPWQWGRRRSNLNGSVIDHTEFSTLLRTEIGLTDRLEFDLIIPAQGQRDRVDGKTVASTFAVADSILGVRYRLLKERSSPFTVTMGPQIILPSGSFPSGTGFDRVGFAWDLATTKDWGGPVFLYNSFNYALFPSVRDPTVASSGRFNLQSISYASAFGIRALERDRGPSHHDIHLYLEYGVERGDSLERNGLTTAKISETDMVFAPGIRYGFRTRYRNRTEKNLFEIGVSFPIGLRRNTPRGGVIFQIQLEQILPPGGK